MSVDDSTIVEKAKVHWWFGVPCLGLVCEGTCRRYLIFHHFCLKNPINEVGFKRVLKGTYHDHFHLEHVRTIGKMGMKMMVRQRCIVPNALNQQSTYD